MQPRFTTEITVPRPPEQVFEFLADAGNNPLWQPGVRECRQEPDGEAAVGTRIHELRELCGRRLRMTYAIVVLDRPGALAVASVGGPLEFSGSYLLHEAPEGTRIRMSGDLTRVHLPGCALRVVRPVAARHLQESARRLAVLLRSGVASAPGAGTVPVTLVGRSAATTSAR